MNTKIIAILACLFLITSSADAGILPRTTGKKVIIETNALHSKSINMQIFDNFGSLIWEVTGQNSLGIKTFNLENLPAGTYTLEVSDESKRLIQAIVVNQNSTISLGEEKIFFKPTVENKGGIIHLNALSFGSDVTFEITDEKNDSVYKAKFDNQQSVQKTYNLKNLPAGSYLLSTTIGGRTYSKSIEK